MIGEGAVIGKNFDIRHNLTIGHSRGQSPVIGDNVTCGANVCIIGNCHIGNHVTVGAGAVVVGDIADNMIVAGNPAKVIGMNFSDQNKF